LKQQDLVTYVGSRSKVSEILSGRRSLSLKMIRALHSEFGIPAEVLLREPGATIPETLPNIQVDKLPLVEMNKRNWLGKVPRSAADLKERAEEIVRAFLATAESCHCLAPRQHVRSGSNMNRGALRMWCVRVAALAGKQRVSKYRPGTISADFMGQLLKLSYLDTGPRLAMEYLTKGGIHMVVLRHLPRTHLDGVAMMLPSGNPVVALTARHDRLDNFWFTLFHELGHIALHFDGEKDACFVDDLDADPEGRECEADEFAQNHLIPAEVWEKARARVEQTPGSVQALADSLRIHPAVIAGRIRREQKNYRILSQLVGLNCVRS
jgi:HTH-type transcriptional regulator / antitoxin HigA